MIRASTVLPPADLLALQLQSERLPFQREFRFHPERRWRFDFAFPERRFAIEVEGGTWILSRHTTGSGFERDCVKYAEALCLGWRVLRVTSGQVHTGLALDWI